MKTKNEVKVRVVLILILIGLCVAVYINGRDLSCDGCVICFENSKLSTQGEVYSQFCLNLTDIHEEFVDGTCLVVYQEDVGYIQSIGKWK